MNVKLCGNTRRRHAGGKKGKLVSLLVMLPMFLLVARAADAARMQSLSWAKTAGQPTFSISFDDTPAFSSERSDDGRRLRLSFPGADMAARISDLRGNQFVKGVFPYASDDGREVYVDILLKREGKLDISASGNQLNVAVVSEGKGETQTALHQAGAAKADAVKAKKLKKEVSQTTRKAKKPEPVKKIAAAKSKKPSHAHHAVKTKKAAKNIVAATASKNQTVANRDTETRKPDLASQAHAIKDIAFTKLSGSKILVKISMDGLASAPGNFATNDPPRLILDFPGVSNNTGKTFIQAGVGILDSIRLAEGKGRSRIVLDLLRTAVVEPEVKGNVVYITLDTSATRPAKKRTAVFADTSVAGSHTVEGVDFRRDGVGGKIVVNLSDPGVAMDLQEGVGEIIVDLSNTHVPAKLQRSLDVSDFATPVRFVDTLNQGKDARLVIKAAGRYEHTAIQSGNQIIITVRPESKEAEEARRKDEFGYTGEKLSLNFQNIDVRAALQVIADFTGINFVTSDTVQGELTLRLKDVPWDQALDTILRAKDLAQRKKGNVIWVAPAKEIAEQEAAELEASKKVAELEPLVNEVIQINYGKAKDFADLIKSIKAVKSVDANLSHPVFGSELASVATETNSNTLLSERGQVTADERTNTILVQDTRGKIAEIKKLVAKLDRPVRQVLIEARIVEASDDFARQLGARFGTTSFTQGAKFNPEDPNSQQTDGFAGSSLPSIDYTWDKWYPDKPDDPPLRAVLSSNNAEKPNWYNVDLAAPGIGNAAAANFGFELWRFGGSFWRLIGLELSALEAEGKGKVIASPRLVTANNVEAHIEQGQERVFTVTVLGVGSVVTKKAVLGLTVTPQITPDERIILDVSVTKDRFASADSPIIDTKQINTQVLLDNGETVVIGGIYEQETVNNVDKVPVVGDIPLLGTLFRRKTKQDNKKELLIFLTPKIITPALNIH